MASLCVYLYEVTTDELNLHCLQLKILLSNTTTATLIGRVIDRLAMGFGPLWSRCTEAFKTSPLCPII
jgi:hypothetical protein